MMASSAIMSSFKPGPAEAETLQVGHLQQPNNSSPRSTHASIVFNGSHHLDKADSTTQAMSSTSNGASNGSSSNVASKAAGPAAIVTTITTARQSRTTPDSSPDSSPPSHRNLHAHRQSHNSSKLPAFRFADLMKKESRSLGLGLTSLLQHKHIPPSPVSPSSPSSRPQSPVNLLQSQPEEDPAAPDPGPAPAPKPDQVPTDAESPPNHLQPASNPAPNQQGNLGLSSGQQGLASGSQGLTSSTTTTVPASPVPAPAIPQQQTHQPATKSDSPHQSSPHLTAPASASATATATTAPAPAPTSATSASATPVSATSSTASSINTANSVTNSIPSPIRSRASTFQTTSASTPITPEVPSKRPASFPDSPSARLEPRPTATDAKSNSPPSASSVTQLGAAGAPRQRRIASSSSSPPRNDQQTTSAGETAGTQSTGNATKEWAQGQRELLLPKTLQEEPADDKKKFRSRPPVSFRPPRNDGSGAVRVPPIRSFRSSGSRKSWTLDMTTAKRRSYDDGSGDDATDPNHHDRALWALEGRSADGGYIQMTPPDSAEPMPDPENTTDTDLFMRIAREDPSRRALPDDRQSEDPSAISRVVRSSHRRPLSAAIPSYQATSPPQVTRRLSDQRETTRPRRAVNEQSAQQMTRELAYRAISKDKDRPAALDDTARSRLAGPSLKSSPATPRSPACHDTPDSSSAYSRRRTSLTDNSPSFLGRVSSFKTTYGQARAYSSSPLVPRHSDPQALDANHGQGVEGTESSASTAAPSTVWDELDDIRSRIHRLEATGRAPPTSGAAMSRASEERPPTANTNATTISGSPKRGSANQGVDASSTTSSQRESQPILLSALAKSKPFVSADAYGALESAATEALALSQMMGTPGQPGPISSGASTIGAGLGVTDRQLRRKADSICRCLTEFCLALADEGSQRKAAAATTVSTPREREVMVTSPTQRSFPMLSPAQRRPAAVGESNLSRPGTTLSPRAMTREERRASLLTTTALPSPRYSLAVGTPTTESPVTGGRKSSLLISRTRRAGTEEPEDQTANAGRKSSLLRTRRAGTEEPADEGRKTSFLLRGSQRLAVNDDDGEEVQFRAPSRAVTELGALRALPRDYGSRRQAAPQIQIPSSRQQQQQQQSQQEQVGLASSPDTGLGSSALPRRRLVPSSLNSRLIAPTPPTPLSGRRYLERGVTPERETFSSNIINNNNSPKGINGSGGGGNSTVIEKLAEDRGQRQFSLNQTALVNRTGSLNRSRRESGIPSLLSMTPATSATAGGGGGRDTGVNGLSGSSGASHVGGYR